MSSSGRETPTVQRHKAAIRRGEPSLPLKCLLRDQLLEACGSFFDYGCGHGEDVRHVRRQGIESSGWDPALRPDTEKVPADAVNLGYVLNVIEDMPERALTLRMAWELCRKVLIVAARVEFGPDGTAGAEFGDGICTRIGTFQKFFTQSELREYIEAVLETDALPAALGVFYVFRDEGFREKYLSTRYRRRAAPRKRISETRFEEHREILEPLMAWVLDRGRVPEPDELPNAGELIDECGSIRRAFSLIRRVTGPAEWDAARQRRSEDLLVYLALANFRRRPRFSRLPLDLQRDIRAFFGAYKKACEDADALLYRTGDADEIDAACLRSSIGKLQPNSLWVHRSAVEDLEPILRVYEGCARAYLGEVEDANIVKLHRFSGKVSHFECPQFESAPHPPLMNCLKLSVRSRQLDWYDYADREDALVLHAKEAFVSPANPLHAKFQRLTEQERRWGVVDDDCTFRKHSEWESILGMHGARLKGHRLVRL